MERCSKTDDEGNTVEYWKCERLQLSTKEYKDLKEKESVFLSPEFQTLAETVAEQAVILAETQLNAEYMICLQELAME